MPSAAIPGGLADFQSYLIGTWSNQSFTGDADGPGSTANPLSYNVMPLPQQVAESGESNYSGYILKNSKVYETVVFYGSDAPVAVPATAPNRGYDQSGPGKIGLQVPTALFYGQTVHFGDGPGVPEVVHVENGAWLNLRTGALTAPGPYPPEPPSGGIVLDDPNQQPPGRAIAKQMSVPHGVSILALGTADAAAAGSPTVSDAPTVPTASVQAPPLDLSVYTTQSPDQNPDPAYTKNPNQAITDALATITPSVTNFIHWQVTTALAPNGRGTTNIPLESSQADVTAYSAEYWLLSNDNGTSYRYLAYSQNITLEIVIDGYFYSFPHWTTNVVTKN